MDQGLGGNHRPGKLLTATTPPLTVTLLSIGGGHRLVANRSAYVIIRPPCRAGRWLSHTVVGVTAGVPPTADDFAAMPKSAAVGQYRIFYL
jgi:hypothetical protein